MAQNQTYITLQYVNTASEVKATLYASACPLHRSWPVSLGFSARIGVPVLQPKNLATIQLSQWNKDVSMKRHEQTQAQKTSSIGVGKPTTVDTQEQETVQWALMDRLAPVALRSP